MCLSCVAAEAPPEVAGCNVGEADAGVPGLALAGLW